MTGPAFKRLAALAIAGNVFFTTCSKTRTLSFAALATADRIQVRDLTGQNDKIVKQVTDPQRIASAVHFIQRHPEGWGEPFGGVPIPLVMLDFYKGDQRLGGFGFDRERIITDPVTYGWWSLAVAAEERDAFLREFELTLPAVR